MPKMTTKLLDALKIAKAIPIPDILEDVSLIYQKLGEHNYFWNIEQKVWEKGKPAFTSIDLVRIRVWVENAKHAKQVVDDVINALSHRNYKLVEHNLYSCGTYLNLIFLPEKNDAP